MSIRVETTEHCTLYFADCRQVLQTLKNQVDVVVTDPPYGETSIAWDRRVRFGSLVRPLLQPHGSLWVFGSLRFFLQSTEDFLDWNIAQEIVWEKHNGSNAFADRFRRVHELAVQFYPADTKWREIHKSPQFTHDATAKAVRRKKRPPQWGEIGGHDYVSHDGGPRLMRSVFHHPSCHGHAIHPTQKPVEVLAPLVEYSCPACGTVLDPFMGSGTVGVVCIQSGRKFIGIENNPEHFEAALERIRAAEKTARSELFGERNPAARMPLEVG